MPLLPDQLFKLGRYHWHDAMPWRVEILAQSRHGGAERSEQFVNGLALWNRLADTTRTKYPEGAGDHDMAALRLQIQRCWSVQPS